MSAKIETYGQESAVKGVRIVDFEVVSEQIRRWINADGSRSFVYSVKELDEGNWIKLDEREDVSRAVGRGAGSSLRE
ncbi:hypothetical protein GOB57_21620 [Sinorhizobium meliloti]|nr:hypothetical protein [Sinorhizobium meliloti]